MSGEGIGGGKGNRRGDIAVGSFVRPLGLFHGDPDAKLAAFFDDESKALHVVGLFVLPQPTHTSLRALLHFL